MSWKALLCAAACACEVHRNGAEELAQRTRGEGSGAGRAAGGGASPLGQMTGVPAAQSTMSHPSVPGQRRQAMDHASGAGGCNSCGKVTPNR